MRTYPFVTVDVFTDRRFGGNQLAVFPDARGLSDAEMQSLAAEFNLSETTFVLPPDDPAHTARVRIFTRKYEMPFAGHPNVGTGFVLAQRNGGDRLVFEEIAGLVEIAVERDAAGGVTGATIAAPQPLSLGERFAPAAIAACAGLEEAAIRSAAHPPVQAGTGNSFILAECAPEALSRAQPDFAAFRAMADAHPGLQGRVGLYLYAHAGPGAVRARMFAPLGGTVEDAATGSAATPLSALLLSLSDREEARLNITQGVEMGRPSLLRTSARRAADGIRASVGGGCVPVLRGEAVL
ncbi:PhzF family phenazine biosynthesis protein [Roseomonas sp. SSH11]|uniref:PhzF family phenazine biosynthesis protein n=1 Tax=Pararoseomonas baculiformis TaxID=2820812 RepID=A0ABS4AE88_9PROT|nr:PhzF family phenazine biosynthesis protein [Pararoseomonas baculiformis]MBP0444865.1 PhzF family phenazine biosynthesis protein [Pararoseomonas baculiformis]